MEIGTGPQGCPAAPALTKVPALAQASAMLCTDVRADYVNRHAAGKRAEIYTYESSNLVYGLNWSVSHSA